MQKWSTLKAQAALLNQINIDTDMIIPKLFLKTIRRTGLGVHLFHDMRYDTAGLPNPDFVLNRAPFDRAQILVTGANFGTGSSREHAPWALLDFGIRCLIAPSYADIFYNNCFKNGLLPITLPAEPLAALSELLSEEGGSASADGDGISTVLEVNLPDQWVQTASGARFSFDLDPFRKKNLLEGLDDIALTLQFLPEIEQYERDHQASYTKRPPPSPAEA